MIIGTGQLAKAFHDFTDTNVIIFASGVSNSNCQDDIQFKREEKLLLETLKNNQDKKFVYFSSCALSVEEYLKNKYYLHKINMEKIIKQYSNKYYIFRVPQLFGDLILHKTLINFIYKSIEHNHKFTIYDEAYRYVIEINDVKKLVESYLSYSESCITIDIANPYRYKVLDIVQIFENILDKKANYEIVKKEDKYDLDLSAMNNCLKKYNINLEFGKKYLGTKLKRNIQKG